MAKKPVKAKAKKSAGAKPKAKAVANMAKPSKKAPPAAKVVAKTTAKSTIKSPAKSPAKSAGKSTDNLLGKTSIKAAGQIASKADVTKKKVTVEKIAPLKGKAKETEKAAKSKKPAGPSIMGSKLKKDADDPEDDFLDDDIEVDPDLAEFVEDVAELEEADAAAEKGIAAGTSGEDEDEAEVPLKKSPKEKSASERRIKKERDLLSGIDRNGDLSDIWQKFFDTHKNEKAKQYNMRETFEAKSSLQHVKLGWGFILSNINDRLEVLFKEGIKILISNYKS